MTEHENADKMHDPKGGLSSEGRKKFKEKDGSNLKPGVKSYSSASEADKKRWISWASRFAGNPQPLKKPNGDPTNYALMFQAWGEKIPTSSADVKAVYDKAMRRKKALGMGEKSAADQAAEFELAKAEPQDKELWDKVVSEAKKKFSTYPSFYANMWVTNTYKKRGGKFKGGKDGDNKPAFLKSAEGEEVTPEAVDTVDGQALTGEDKTKLTKLRTEHKGSQAAARALSSSTHRLAQAIGADADAFIDLQMDSIAHLLGNEEDTAGPRDYRDTMPEESSALVRGDGVGTIMVNGKTYHLSSGSGIVAGKGIAANTVVAKLTERRKSPTDLEAADVPRARAFVTQAHGRTVVTGPAAAFTGGWQKALSANEHMLWIQGRLVGGETPNRNGALWTAGDLEMGQPTVAHGPLNWLHEARHVIGSIADSRFMPATASSNQLAAETVDPHIIAAAGIWNWLYPDEAMVVQQASDLGQLWYSMECISKDVECPVDRGGCGHTIDYFTFARDEPGTCEHMQQRSNALRFAEPTFLGAAVIVPPTRPGWADADASVMAEAASLSEKAYEQTGKPDMSASVFEQMVAQVVKYTQM